MLRTTLLSIAFVLGTMSPAAADDPIRPKNFPNCTKYKIDIGGSVCGYENIEDWKLVLHADVDLTDARAQLKNEQQRSALLAQQLEQTTIEAAARAEAESVVKERNSALTKQLIELDEKYQAERVKPTWGSPVAWTIAGVSTAALAGILLFKLVD